MFSGDALAHRFQRLGSLIEAWQPLWRPQPFKVRRPAWCAAHAELMEALLALDATSLARLTADGGELLRWLSPWLPQASELAELSELPAVESASLPDPGPHFAWGIPGRKQTQIEAFCAAVGEPAAPVIEWCAGKGHLGRRVAAAWDVAVDSLDYDPELVRQGTALATRARQSRQVFAAADLRMPAAGKMIAGRHVLALHACGDLHRDLVRAAPGSGVVALDVSPCCYARTRDDHLRFFTSDVHLRLDRDDLRLVVTDSVNTAPREAALRRQESAWKLGFLSLLGTGETYRPLSAIPTAWLREDFVSFCRRLCQREAIDFANHWDMDAAEQTGWQRLAEVERLSLPRFAVRRPIEVWLALDAACYLQAEGFDVAVATFCEPVQTPRNLLISARRRAVGGVN